MRQFSYYDSGAVNRPWLTVKRDVRGNASARRATAAGISVEEVSPTGQTGTYTLQREFEMRRGGRPAQARDAEEGVGAQHRRRTGTGDQLRL